MQASDKTLTPQDLVEGYMRSYHALHGRTPRVRHMSGYWYNVNGEIVHRSTLVQEILHLRQTAHQRKPVERSIVHRIIARLKRA
jgi:hypothetical protein